MKKKVKAIMLLKRYAKIFIFGYQDMPSMDPDIMVHNIITHQDAKPIKQNSIRVNLAQSLQIKDEIHKFLDTKFNYPLDYPQWVSNMFPIDKLEGCIRVCINFRDLNATCPKDDFLFSNIDALVDNTSRYEMLSLMDGFSSYNQIWFTP